MKKDDISKKRKLPTIDHGIDIIGDEWDEEEEWASNEVNADTLQNEENWEDEADVRMIYNDVQIGKKQQKKKKV